MDYTGIVKRAWKVVWRYRILWLFGLFAGGAGGGGRGGNANFNYGGGDMSSAPEGVKRLFDRLEGAGQWFLDNLAVLVILASVLVFVGIIWWILSIAAMGGLVHLVNEAEEGRPVRGSDGWRIGFHYWWRTLGLGVVLILPIIAVVALMFGVAIVVMAPLSSGSGPDASGAAVGAILGLCCFGGVFVVLLFLASLLISVLIDLGLRYIVLEDRGVFAAIGDAWSAVRTRFKDVAVMWLLTLAVGIGFGIVFVIIGGVLGLPAIIMLLAGSVEGALLILVALFFVLLLPSAIYGAFRSAIWTEFFRDFTGRGAASAAATVDGYPPSSPAPQAEPAQYLPPPPAPQAPAAPVPPPPAPPGPPPPPEEPHREG